MAALRLVSGNAQLLSARVSVCAELAALDDGFWPLTISLRRIFLADSGGSTHRDCRGRVARIESNVKGVALVPVGA